METETSANPYMDPWRDREPGDLPTPTAVQRHREYLAAQAADPQCTRCGTHTKDRECPDWCLRIGESCDCGSALCGHCQRSLGTTTASMGHPVR